MRQRLIWFLVVVLVLLVISLTPLGPAMGRFLLAILNVIGALFGLIGRAVGIG